MVKVSKAKMIITQEEGIIVKVIIIKDIEEIAIIMAIAIIEGRIAVKVINILKLISVIKGATARKIDLAIIRMEVIVV